MLLVTASVCLAQATHNITMPDPVELTNLHQNLNYHYPKSYLNAWAQGVRPDWARFLHSVFTEDAPRLLPPDSEPAVLDLGCGPSICNVISASLVSSRIRATNDPSVFTIMVESDH